MITKITRGTDFGGLMDYLVAVDKQGLHNVHTNPRVVAGPTGIGFNGVLSKADAKVIAGDLRVPLDLHKTPVKDGPVWHCSLSLGSNEAPLTDLQWHDVATDFMKEMGFEDPAKAGCRWVAVNHGVSREGNHHVHIVADLVREDGSRVNVWQDMPRSQKAALAVEMKHGLSVVQSRLAKVGAGSIPYTAGEAARAVKTDLPVERVDLERRVRAAATTAQSEAEFVRLARADGLLIRPFPAQGDVTGYSVGVPAPPGEKQLFFAGGKLARDLSLPRLKNLWPDNGGSRSAANAEWRRTAPIAAKAPPAPPVTVVEEELDLLAEQLQSGDPEEFAAASGELSGALATASVSIEGNQPGNLARASRQVGAWSGTPHAVGPAKRGKTAGRGVGLLLLQAAMDPTGPIAQAVMRRQLMEMLLALHQLHRSNRPTMASTGRGTTMHEPDGIDDAAEGLVTTGLTLSAAGIASYAHNRAQEREAGNVKTKVPFRDRFHLSRVERPSEFGERERDRVPTGLAGVISADEWRGMDARQRSQVDPDNVGRWATDYEQGTPGATLPSTADQLERLSVLSEVAGRQVIGADQMTRGTAAGQLQRLEKHLGREATESAYLDAGLVARRETWVETSHESFDRRFELVFPGDEWAKRDPEVLAIDAVHDADRRERETISRTATDEPRQLRWPTANDPVTKPQRYRLSEMGLAPEEISKLRKGWASVVIEAGLDGPAHTRQAYEAAVEKLVQSAPVNAPRPGAEQPVNTPKPPTPPNRGGRM